MGHAQHRRRVPRPIGHGHRKANAAWPGQSAKAIERSKPIMDWTPEQKQAIDQRGKNILVAAAAGSGKTTVLVERIKKLIIDDHVDIDRMLVVTFTKAAATEMREKIIKAINQEIEDGEAKGQDTSFLRRQIDIIHRAQISTFHSFGEQVIKENFHAIGLEPSLSICDEAEGALLKQKAVEVLLEDKFEESSPEFLDFVDAYGQEKSDGKIQGLILEGHKKLMSLPYPWKWLDERCAELENPGADSAVFKYAVDYTKEQIARAAKKAMEGVQILEDEGLPKLAEKLKVEVDRFLEVAEIVKQPDMTFGKMKEALDLFKGVTLKASTEEKANYDDKLSELIKLKRKVYKETIDEPKKKFFAMTLDEHVEELKAVAPRFKMYAQLLKQFDQEYRALKDARKAIDFSDIEHYCLEILEEKRIADVYRERFQHIFVDEYQDSNLVQEEIISKIARENNRFLVGDVKQSIYKFRLAEPEIFHDTYEKFADPTDTNSIKIDLNTNYRSKSNVIGTVNLFFEDLMEGYDDAAALHQGDKYHGDLDYPTTLHLLDIGNDLEDMDDAIRDMEKTQREALLVTNKIEEILAGQEIYDSKEEKVRKVEKKDIVILLRGTKNKAQYYYEALMDHNIPAYISGDEGYYGTIEVDAIVNLLQVISNKQQDIPLIAVLHSEVFDFSLEEVMEIRIQFRHGTFAKAWMRYGKEGDDLALREKCAKALDKINEWKKLSGSLPLDQFIWKVMNESGIYLTMGAFPGGVQRQANLRELVDKAVNYQSKNVPTLNGFMDYIEALREKKIQVGQVKLVGENDDLVRIMTIHKSKGLEFPVVILADMGRGNHNQSDAVPFHKNLGIGLPIVNKKEHWKKNTILGNAISAQNAKEALEEEIRVLYVALTRAKDQLILFGSHKDLNDYREKISSGIGGTNNYLSMIGPAAYRSALVHIDGSSSSDLSKSIHVRKRKLDAVLRLFHEDDSASASGGEVAGAPGAGTPDAQGAGIAQKVKERVCFQYPYNQALGMKQKYSVSELNRQKLVSEAGSQGDLVHENRLEKSQSLAALGEVKLLQKQGKLTAAEKGTLFHKIMEHVDFAQMCQGPEQDLNTVKTLTADMVNRDLLVQEELDQIDLGGVAKFFETPIAQRAVAAAKAGKLYRETPFTYQMDIEGEKVLVQGIIDAFFEEEDQLVLLDYKTNYISKTKSASEEKQRIKDHYTVQMDIYQKALSSGMGKDVKEAYLYINGIGDFVNMKE